VIKMGAFVTSIFSNVYCISCIWTLLSMLGTFGAGSYFMNSWVPFKGPLPSDGPVEGFASKAARIEFYDTTPLRIRSATKAGVIGGVLWLVGLVTSYLIMNSLGGGA
jgi:hypothetical protein